MVYTKDVTTLLQDGLNKVLEGITSFEEIYKLIEIDNELDNLYDAEIGSKVEKKEPEEEKKDVFDKTEVLDLNGI
jgi:hypothetical protein